MHIWLFIVKNVDLYLSPQLSPLILTHYISQIVLLLHFLLLTINTFPAILTYYPLNKLNPINWKLQFNI